MSSTEFTNEFVAKLVHQPVKSFEVGEGSKPGDNVAGALKAITVTTMKDEVIHLVHKTFPADPLQHGFIVKSGTFRIENIFYSVLAPQLEAVLKSRNMADSSLPIPKFYAGFNDDANDYVTMEDMRPSGYVMPDKYKGLNLKEVNLILKKLAKFHATTHFLLRYEGEKFLEQYPLIAKSKWLDRDIQEEGQLMMTGAMKATIELVKSKNEELAKKMEAAFAVKSPGDLTSQTMRATDSKYFPCIIHGDIWCNNTLFSYETNSTGESVPVDVKFIDFQQVRRGNIFEDLQYFVYTSTSPEFRRHHLYEILDVYYDSFVDTMSKLDCSKPINFTRGFLVDNFENCIFPAYTFMSAFALPLQWGIMPPMQFDAPPGPPMAPLEEGQEPPAFNMDDLPLEIRVQGFVAHVAGMMKNCPKAIDRVLELTEEMIERGYL